MEEIVVVYEVEKQGVYLKWAKYQYDWIASQYAYLETANLADISPKKIFLKDADPFQQTTCYPQICITVCFPRNPTNSNQCV